MQFLMILKQKKKVNGKIIGESKQDNETLYIYIYINSIIFVMHVKINLAPEIIEKWNRRRREEKDRAFGLRTEKPACMHGSSSDY